MCNGYVAKKAKWRNSENGDNQIKRKKSMYET